MSMSDTDYAAHDMTMATNDLRVMVEDMGQDLVNRMLISAQKFADNLRNLTATPPGKRPSPLTLRRSMLIIRMYLEANLYTSGSDEITSLVDFFGMRDVIDLCQPIPPDDFYRRVWSRTRHPSTPGY